MISAQFKENLLHVGDTIRVKSNIVEGGKTRVQAFEGLLIAITGSGNDKTITVRRIGDRGVGVERKWPLNARNVVDIEVTRKPKKVRRSKLYHLREVTGKMATRI